MIFTIGTARSKFDYPRLPHLFLKYSLSLLFPAIVCDGLQMSRFFVSCLQ